MRPRVAGRDLAVAAATSAAGLLGALPGAQGADPLALCTWLALASAPLGAFAGASLARAWPLAPVPPAAWMIALAAADVASARDLPSPIWAVLAWTGLYAAGWGAGRLARPRAAAAAGALLLAALLLAGPAVGFGVLRAPPAPAFAARALDASPVVLVLESAGVDPLRMPWVYDHAGGADVDPALRRPWRGALAGPIALLVGCLLAAACLRAASAR